MCLAQIRTITPMGIDCKWIREAFGTGMKQNGGEMKRSKNPSLIDNGGFVGDRFQVELARYL